MPTPTTNYGITKPDVGGQLNSWGATNNSALDTVDDTLYRHSVVPVASAAARAVTFPQPIPNQRTQRTDTGTIDRYDPTAAKWLPEGITRAAGLILSSMAKGTAKGDGIADDKAALVAMDALTVANGGQLQIDLGVTHLIGSNMTFSGRLKHWKTGIFKLAVGVTVTISGLFDAGLHKCFDCSAANSSVVFTGGNAPYTRPHWWGVVGNEDGSGAGTDDTAALTSATVGTPNGMVLRFTSVFGVKLTNTLTITNRDGLELSSGLYLNNINTGPRLYWFGAAAGTMVFLQYSRYCTVQGLNFKPRGIAAIGVLIDDYNGGLNGSRCIVSDCYFDNQYITNPTWTAVYIGKLGNLAPNHEYHMVRRCTAILSSDGTNNFRSCLITCAAGGVAFTITGASSDLNFGAGANLMRIRFKEDNGNPIDRMIATHSNGTTGTIQGANLATGATTRHCIIGGADSGGNAHPAIGIFVRIGANPNYKNTIIRDNFVNTDGGCGIATIWMDSGSFHSSDNDMHSCEANIVIVHASETCSSFKDNSESSIRHWQGGNTSAVGGQVTHHIDETRMAIQNCCPIDGYITTGNEVKVLHVENCQIDQYPGAGATFPAGAQIFDLTNLTGVAHVHDNRFPDNPANTTLAQAGLDALLYANTKAIRLDGNQGLTLYPGVRMGAPTIAGSGIHQIGGIDADGNPVKNTFDGALAVNRWNNAGAKWPIAWWWAQGNITPGTINAGVTFTATLTVTNGGMQNDGNKTCTRPSFSTGGAYINIGNGLIAWAEVTAFNTITFFIFNPTAAPITVNAGNPVQATAVAYHVGSQ